ncbi:hypothetical protein C8R44DRAFT_988733 [Mycena epipterygia]|nr:hypothetical protein C8R44DRAFT_988733 [Mycena epipterygia]
MCSVITVGVGFSDRLPRFSTLYFPHPDDHFQALVLYISSSTGVRSHIHFTLPPMLTVAAAFLSGVFLEIFLYGVYTVLFSTVMYLFHRRHRIPGRKPANWVLLGLVLQFVAITAYGIAIIYRACFSFLRLGGGSAADAFDINLSTPPAVMESTLCLICTLITDLLVTHRVYAIFSSERMVVFLPLTFLVGQAVCEGGILYHFVKSHPGDHLPSVLNGWVTTSLVLSIMTSVYSSAMLSWKICRISRAVNGLSERISGGMRLTSVLAILVESAMLQTATTIAILVSIQLDSVGQYIVLTIAPTVFGISTVLIHVRIGLGWAHDCSGHTGTNPTRISFAVNESGESEEQQLGHPGRK